MGMETKYLGNDKALWWVDGHVSETQYFNLQAMGSMQVFNQKSGLAKNNFKFFTLN